MVKFHTFWTSEHADTISTSSSKSCTSAAKAPNWSLWAGQSVCQLKICPYIRVVWQISRQHVLLFYVKCNVNQSCAIQQWSLPTKKGTRHKQAALCDLSAKQPEAQRRTVMNSSRHAVLHHPLCVQKVQDQWTFILELSICTVTTVCSIQQCFTGARVSKREGAAPRTWHTPVIHPML